MRASREIFAWAVEGASHGQSGEPWTSFLSKAFEPNCEERRGCVANGAGSKWRAEERRGMAAKNSNHTKIRVSNHTVSETGTTIDMISRSTDFYNVIRRRAVGARGVVPVLVISSRVF